MPLILAAIGAALLAYCVFLISGTGIAVTAFIGIMLIVIAIYWWFLQLRAGMLLHHNELFHLIRTHK